MAAVPYRYWVRSLQVQDYHHGFLELLNELSPHSDPPMSLLEFQKCMLGVQQLLSARKRYVLVVFDVEARLVVATGTLWVEDKFSRGACTVGHIEDLVVTRTRRKLGLGQRVVSLLQEKARAWGCRKVVLQCHERLVAWYSRLGFAPAGRCMSCLVSSETKKKSLALQ